eukprot:CAMPEP_0172012892 /NCGR_PEP_ID=MMETSP1041-20130122/9086_1 /TAXON_ID=464988 /ORGANISM="Hemiselmis andersenii, Strain CCMP439" /LENGTH=39 /DNA_ID= /DNA_START= /DNA_END= /DNA_ORIENTATION=
MTPDLLGEPVARGFLGQWLVTSSFGVLLSGGIAPGLWGA